ncbi:MAG: hypothetical protein OSJ74_00430 [Clostridia bacterium]|nr:hypothetical protein [Clostridia bacterium]
MKKKLFGIAFIICLATIISCASVFSNPQSATAENIDVLVSLDNASLLAAYGDLFAYTQGKTICVAKNNKLLSFEEKSDFDEFVDVAINSTHIIALAKKGDDKYLWAYEYNDRRIAKISHKFSGLFLNYIVGVYADNDGKFFVMETNKVNSVSLNPDETNSAYFNSNTSLDDGLYKGVKDFAVSNNVLYCIDNGNFYEINEQNFNYSDLSKFLKKSGDYISLSAIGDKVLLLNANGIFGYDISSGALSSFVEEGLDQNSNVCCAYDKENNVCYAYAKSSQNAVNMYLYVDGKLEYYGCFDNTVYTHPVEYDIVNLYKTTSGVTLYSSPRHLQRMGVIPRDEYLVALSKKDGYIYVYYHNEKDNKTQYGYIKENSGITLCPAQKDTPIGAYAQPLHENTAIYKYPFAGSEKLVDASIYLQLIVINNVGQDGDYTWGWYKVGFVDSQGKTVYGYIKAENASPYTQLTAPSLSKSVKLTSKKLGQYISLYALPFDNEENAIEVAQLAEGSSVYLKEKFDKNREWTAVYYDGKTVYVRTANIRAFGLTSWQLALAITVPCVVVAIVAAVVILIVAKNKKSAYIK